MGLSSHKFRPRVEPLEDRCTPTYPFPLMPAAPGPLALVAPVVAVPSDTEQLIAPASTGTHYTLTTPHGDHDLADQATLGICTAVVIRLE